jgi:hypothetical protein
MRQEFGKPFRAKVTYSPAASKLSGPGDNKALGVGFKLLATVDWTAEAAENR